MKRFRIGLLVGLVAACSGGGDGGTGPTRVPTGMTLVSGGGQFGEVAARLGSPIVVEVRDSRGGIPGVSVGFAVGPGDGSVEPSAVMTDGAGRATVQWTLGPAAGPQTLLATVPNVAPLSVPATGDRGPPARMVVATGGFQFGVVKRAVPLRPAARVTDAHDNPIDGVQVSFGIATGGGTLTGPTVNTDAAGVATVGSWTLGPKPGPQSIVAFTVIVGGVTFSATGTPASLARRSPVDQTANAGTAVPIAPLVEALDPDGIPLEDVEITFREATGGGRVEGNVVRTNRAGRAHPAAWIIGLLPGSNEIVAETPGLPGGTAFHATGLEAQPAALVAVRGDHQIGFPGNVTPDLPTVRVLDASQRPVAGASVTFELSGAGTVVAAAATSDQAGEATLGGWRLGPAPGNEVVRATAGGLPPVSFAATIVPRPVPAFAIDLRFLGGGTASQQAALQAAADRWATLLLGDVPDVPISFDADPAGCHPAIHETVDDVVIFVQIDEIDGPGGILGAAGSCLARENSFLPVVGTMILDEVDLTTLEQQGLLQSVMTHEMGHILGFDPTIWDLKELITGMFGPDPLFLGRSARGAYLLLEGGVTPGRKIVPLENSGGPGTRDAHWRESVLGAELMTGYADPGTNPLSALTVASFRDLGYVVDDSAADPFQFLAAVRAAGAPPLFGPVPHTRRWAGPLRLVDLAGRVSRAFR